MYYQSKWSIDGMFEQIPADLVVNALLAAMAKHAKRPGLQVYQVASSVVNPMTFNILADVALELFTKDPMVDRTGKPIKVRRMRFVQSMDAFNLYMWCVYQLPLLVRLHVDFKLFYSFITFLSRKRLLAMPV